MSSNFRLPLPCDHVAGLEGNPLEEAHPVPASTSPQSTSAAVSPSVRLAPLSHVSSGPLLTEEEAALFRRNPLPEKGQQRPATNNHSQPLPHSDMEYVAHSGLGDEDVSSVLAGTAEPASNPKGGPAGSHTSSPPSSSASPPVCLSSLSALPAADVRPDQPQSQQQTTTRKMTPNRLTSSVPTLPPLEPVSRQASSTSPSPQRVPPRVGGIHVTVGPSTLLPPSLGHRSQEMSPGRGIIEALQAKRLREQSEGGGPPISALSASPPMSPSMMGARPAGRLVFFPEQPPQQHVSPSRIPPKLGGEHVTLIAAAASTALLPPMLGRPSQPRDASPGRDIIEALQAQRLGAQGGSAGNSSTSSQGHAPLGSGNGDRHSDPSRPIGLKITG